MSKSFAVVGASCVDIFATSANPLILHDSNPGTVQIGFGGVGRNIAENLARLGQNVDLFAAFGSDVFSSEMLKHTTKSGVNTSECLIADAKTAPFYIAVNDNGGDMAVAVNDMDISTLLTPAYLQEKLGLLNSRDAVILDTNLSTQTIHFLVNHCTAPLYADGVSVSKVSKLAGILPRLAALNVNLLEAQALLNESFAAELPSLKRAGRLFHQQGVDTVLITLGAKGAFISTGSHQMLMNAFPTETRNFSGCGDAFSAAAFIGVANGYSHEDILANALACAALTAGSTQSVW